jgi:hypothetical protein
VQQVEGLTGEDGGTYFVDQTGQYYYQANGDDTPVLTQVQIQEVSEGDGNIEEATNENQYQEIEELEQVDAENHVIYFTFKLC